MRVFDVFGGKVRVVVSDKRDGNMRAFLAGEKTQVAENQAKVGAALGADNMMVVRCSYDRDDFLRYETDIEPPISDGIVVKSQDVGLILPLADCLGVVLYDKKQRKVMLVHAGRHNLEQDGLVRAVEYIGGNPADIWAYFSPVAGKEKYEIRKLGGMGIAEAAKEQLVRAGVELKNIEEMGVDTTMDERYYSHSQGDTGARFAIGVRML